ncbi:hypothetical protein [Nocardiopsis xinjiangensis]|uniref:hypothetical protein n=1 Tax=Nocardiopsis xinjiangensis TaxID=124285 RepID=UPI00036759BA|nr:hypothetical protein [Nocardiopsis xinjiangensis]
MADGYVGQVVLSTTVVGTGGTWGARPDPRGRYLLDPASESAAHSVAHAYRRFREDLRAGTSLVSDFAHGLLRHRSLEG